MQRGREEEKRRNQETASWKLKKTHSLNISDCSNLNFKTFHSVKEVSRSFPSFLFLFSVRGCSQGKTVSSHMSSHWFRTNSPFKYSFIRSIILNSFTTSPTYWIILNSQSLTWKHLTRVRFLWEMKSIGQRIDSALYVFTFSLFSLMRWRFELLW